ncbi:MAG: hypothetical protein FJ271_08085 [Planctomycetes bacterium]|nr:hypothetical protein [Planctomycetota bacterium]
MLLRKLGMGLLTLGLVGLIGSAALAQPPGKGKPGGKGKAADKMKAKGKHGDKGRGGWGRGFGGPRGGFAKRGRHHRGRYAAGPRGHRGRYASRGYHGHRGRHAWGRGGRGFGRHAHRGHRGGRGWGRPSRGARFGMARPGFGGRGRGFAGRGFAGKGFGGKGAFAMGGRDGLLKSLKLTEEQTKKIAELRKTEAAAVKKALEASRADMRKGLKGILTAEQYKKLEEATKKFKAPSGKGKDKGKDKGKQDKKSKADVDTSAAPVQPASRQAAVAVGEASRLNREATARFTRRE